MPSLKSVLIFVASTGFASLSDAAAGKTTRYWDCCKGSCSWSGKAPVSNPVKTCDKNDKPLKGYDEQSACEDGGKAYMCSDQSPWAVSDKLAYGFAAVSMPGGDEKNCCACFE